MPDSDIYVMFKKYVHWFIQVKGTKQRRAESIEAIINFEKKQFARLFP
jgi:hypothetical protein